AVTPAGGIAGAEAGAPRMSEAVSGSLPALVPAPPSPRGPGAPEEPGAIFLRADRLEGNADKTIEAWGKVELRTRRETVLADFLRYDVPNDEIFAKGDVTL